MGKLISMFQGQGQRIGYYFKSLQVFFIFQDYSELDFDPLVFHPVNRRTLFPEVPQVYLALLFFISLDAPFQK